MPSTTRKTRQSRDDDSKVVKNASLRSRRVSTRSEPAHQSTDTRTTEDYMSGDDAAGSEEGRSLDGKKNTTKKSLQNGTKRRRHADEEEDYSETKVAAARRKVYDSDALDDDSEVEDRATRKRRKKISASPTKKSQSPRKRKKVVEDEEYELEEGQEIVGVVVKAPTTGRVPAGQISQNTLDFLTKLQNPKYNDREWFKLNEPVYRVLEKEWKDFVEAFTEVVAEVDPQIPHLPPKDVIHRIYRDIRFSNDKTPYKRNLSATFSRSGRKGIFACYHISVKAGGESMIAAGSWCPGKNELATIRSNIQRNPRRLRDIISSPAFEELFGEAKPAPKGARQNIFGAEDELKIAPKGIDKEHRDIDLLKCRSFAVSHRFADDDVLSPDFKEKVADVLRVMRPFVHCLNDMMTIQGGGGGGDDEEEDEEEAED